MILIVGGTGRLGGLVANHLHARGVAVRALSRGLTPLRSALDGDIEVVRGDVREPMSLRGPMEGIEVVVSAVQGFAGPGGVTPESVDRDGNLNLVEAAERVGADLVLVSVIGAAPDSPMELMRMKYVAEASLRASALRWTIVRADAYIESWMGILERTAGRSGRPVVFGRGDNPISWVSVEDVAALVERAVLEPGLRGRTLEICGPQSETLTRLAEMVMSRHGWVGKPRHVPRSALHLMANTVGRVKPTMGRQARAALAMDTLPTAGDDALRAEFPDLPCTPVDSVVSAPR
jgi:uncharacterized protein YbjT (DUF2867 family)